MLAALATPASAELAFTDALIARNFSNGSAWHQRTRVLLHGRPSREAPAVLRGELDKVREAMFTEPDDQSAWMYQRWVLAQILARRQATAGAATAGRAAGAGPESKEGNFYGVFMQRLSANGRREAAAPSSTTGKAGAAAGANREKEVVDAEAQHFSETDGAALFSQDTLAEIFALEIRTCRELIEIEPSCRWPRLQLLHMIEKLQQASLDVPEEAGAGGEQRRLLGELLELDPTHAGYYRDCLRKL